MKPIIAEEGGRFLSRARRVAAAILPTIAVLLALELIVRGSYTARRATIDVVPLPYVLGHAHGPAPPWRDAQRILEKDPALIWRGRRNVRRSYMDIFTPAWEQADRVLLLHQFLPRLPESLADNPVWEVALNSEGFRDRELPEVKPPGVIRIVCLGDSWTFGANVDPDDSYPRQLARLLNAAHPDTRFEVFNLGVLGYSSYQGLQLLRQRALALRPDFVLIGFAMNDGTFAYRDRDVVMSDQEPPSIWKRIDRLIQRSELIRLLHYWTAFATWEPDSPATALVEKRRAGEDQPIDWVAMASWIRVPLPEYRDNIQEMIRLVRGSGAGAILLYNELETESPYLEGLREVAAESNAPLIDSSALIDAERRRIEAAHSERLGVSSAGLKTGPQDAVDVLFRVRQGERQLPNGLFITGNHSSLANGEPNILPMSDDGSNGDERAGDGLWSYQARFEPGTRVAYVYTNGGVAGRWLGLDVPAIRRTRAPESTGHVLYRPIESFGQITLQADSWHTDATGYALISEAILEAFREIPDFRRRIDAGRDEAHSR